MSQKKIKSCPKSILKNGDIKWDRIFLCPSKVGQSPDKKMELDNFGTEQNTGRTYSQRISPSVPLFLLHSIIITQYEQEITKYSIYREGKKIETEETSSFYLRKAQQKKHKERK